MNNNDNNDDEEEHKLLRISGGSLWNGNWYVPENKNELLCFTIFCFHSISEEREFPF